jgi:hypothetical protein
MFRSWRELVRDPLWWLIVGGLLLYLALRDVPGQGWVRLVVFLLVIATVVVERVTRPVKKAEGERK